MATKSINLSLLGGFDPTNPPGVEVVSEKAKLLFSNTATKYIYKTFKLPIDLSSSPVLHIQYAMSSATSGAVVWACEVMSITPGDAASVNTDSYDTANIVTDTVPGTAGHLKQAEIPLTDFDSAVAGDWVTLKIYRDTGDTSDTATGNAGIVSLSLNYEASSAQLAEWSTVSDTTYSGASEVEIPFDDDTASRWEIEILDAYPTGTDTTPFVLYSQLSIGNSPTYESSGYVNHSYFWRTGASNYESATGTTEIILSNEGGNDTGESTAGIIHVFDPRTAGKNTKVKSTMATDTYFGGTSRVETVARLTSTESVTSMRIYFSGSAPFNGRVIVRKFTPNVELNPATITQGAGVPSTTPSIVGNTYVDTTNDEAYTAVGVASSADWRKTTNEWIIVSDTTYASPAPTEIEVNFDDVDSTEWEIHLLGVYPGGVDTTPLHLDAKLSIGNSPLYETTNYKCHVSFFRSDFADYTGTITNGFRIINDAGNASGESTHGVIRVFEPQNANTFTKVSWETETDVYNGGIQKALGTGSLNTLGECTKLKLEFLTGVGIYGRVIVRKWKPGGV